MSSKTLRSAGVPITSQQPLSPKLALPLSLMPLAPTNSTQIVSPRLEPVPTYPVPTCPVLIVSSDTVRPHITSSTLLSIATEIRHNILFQCFTGFETYYNHEGKRHVNQEECDENTFAICNVNSQIRKEALAIVKAKTAILDCTTSENNPVLQSKMAHNVPLGKVVMKRILILKLNIQSSLVPDQHLFPNLMIIAIAGGGAYFFHNKSHLKSEGRKPEYINSFAKEHYLGGPPGSPVLARRLVMLPGAWPKKAFEDPSRKALIWTKHALIKCDKPLEWTNTQAREIESYRNWWLCLDTERFVLTEPKQPEEFEHLLTIESICDIPFKKCF